MYKTILVPLENSAADETILQHLRPLARLMGSQLHLVHVADGFAARNQESLNLEDSEEIRRDRAYLQQRTDELVREGFAVSSQLLLGDPARELADFADAQKCDLIAMCTHGHRLLQDLVLGSVANDLRHRTKVPILLVRMADKP